MDYLLHIENYIEEKYRLIADIEGPFEQSKEFLNLYSNVGNKHLKIIFLYYILI